MASKIYDYTLGELKELFKFENEEVVSRKFKSGTYRPIKLHISPQGYTIISVKGRNRPYHRIKWELTHNKLLSSKEQIDHIDGNRSNNAIENLRVVTCRENCQNMYCHRQGKIVGARTSRYKNKTYYEARMWLRGRQRHIGRYSTEEEAHRTYMIACENIDRLKNRSIKQFIEIIRHKTKQEKMSSLESNHNKKAIRCLETMEIFNNISEASLAKGISFSSIRDCLVGRTKKAGQCRWEFLSPA